MALDAHSRFTPERWFGLIRFGSLKRGARGGVGFRWLGFVAGFWLALILTAMVWLTNYSFTPGAAGVNPVSWPEFSQVQRAPDRPTLLLFAHPRCPCTRATIGELARLAANCPGRFTAQVWFAKPAAVSEDWTQTDLWRTAAAIPGVSVYADEAGQEAARFAAQTSGHTMLYDATGQLLFQGGITISRGHAGDNPGRTALEDLLMNRNQLVQDTPVFGCALSAAAQTREEVAWNP